jgi:uncharacterized coiled-coil DUF342 family protein
MTPKERLALNQIKSFLKYNFVTGDLSNDISIQIIEKSIDELISFRLTNVSLVSVNTDLVKEMREVRKENESLKLKHAKVTELLGLYQEKSDLLVQIINNQNPRHHEIRNELQDKYMICLEKIDTLKKEIEEMK